MFKNIFKFPFGYVIIEIIGKDKERFLDMCLVNRFRISDVIPTDNGLQMKIEITDFMKIRRQVRKCRVKVRIIEKHSIKRFAKEHRYRVVFPIAGIVICIYFLVMPQYIWCVEIDGAKRADTQKVAEILERMGVYAGAKKKDIADLGEIKNAVVFGEPEINWAWLYIEGAKARLEVQERVPPPEVADKTTPTSIIAAQDGFVRIAEVKRGERHVVAGDSVSKGDVLVSGKVAVFGEGYPEKYSYVNSNARIIADTVRTENGTFLKTETIRIKTGATKKRVTIELFGKQYNPMGQPETVFDKCEVKTVNYDATLPIFGYLGFGLKIHTVYEINEVKNELDKDEVLLRAKETLEERIMKTVGIEAEKTDEELTYSIDGDEYNVRLRMNFRENIGIKIPQEE